MDYIGRASETNFLGQKLSRAQKKIKQFPILCKIVNNFDGATDENHYENRLLNLAGATDENYDSYLMEIENLLNELLKSKSINKKDLFFRLKTFGEKHFQKIYELEFYLELRNNVHVSNISYEEKKQKHDFKFYINKVEFNVELTSFGKGEIERKINGAFTLASREIMKVLPNDSVLLIYITTDKLGEIGGGVNSSDIAKIIIQHFNKIRIFCLACRNNSLTLEGSIGGKDQTLFECRNYFSYKESKQVIAELIKTEQGIDYLKSITVKDILDNPISSIIFIDGKNKGVEIQSTKIMPSIAEDLRRKSLVRQLKDLLKCKINKQQLKGQKNPFIALHFEDFAFHNYYSPSDDWGQNSFNELSKIVQEVFIETQEKKLLGVLFYFQKISKSAFVQNPNIKINNKILNKIDIIR